MLTFRVLGSLELTGSDGATLLPILAQPKRTALLAYLAAARRRGYHRRDQLVALFWPELDQERARAALSTALNHLRRTLGDEVLVTRGTEEIALDREQVWCDAVAFEEALDAEEPERALELYRGDFLAGFFLADCAEFEQWVERERHRLARLHQRALEHMAQEAEATGDRLAAVSWWQRVSEQDPFSTRVALQVMKAMEAAGNRAGALQHAEQHADRLRTELDAAPAPDVTAYADRLRAHPAAHPSLSPTIHPVSEPQGVEHLASVLADRYRIERELGHGGMATVYLAHDLKHHRRVAVKVLRPELTAALGSERFLGEIEITARLDHPHILPLLESGEADGFLYYVMPAVEGESLRERLRRDRQLPIDDATRIAREVADALAFAHRHDVVHRDIKPANILLGAGHARVADFGIARAIKTAGGARLTETGLSVGTPEYMSPEQVSGDRDLDGRSDLYSLGCVLYEMLAGQPPFTGPTTESIARQHLTAEPRPLIDLRERVPVVVADAVGRALAKNPADRFATAQQFAEALTVVEPPYPPAVASAGHRNRTRVLAGVGAVIVGAIGLALWQPWDSGAGESGRPTWAWTVLAEVEGSAPENIREVLGSLLAGDLDATGSLLSLPEDQILLGLERAMKPDTTRLTPAVARELAERAGIETVFVPELDQVGDTYVLTVRVLHAVADSVLATERVSAVHDDGLIPASREVVGSLVPIVRAWEGGRVRPADERTFRYMDPEITFSLQAFRKHEEAESANILGRYHEAVALCREALAIDPDFAQAWSRMGTAYRNAGFHDSAAYAWQEALKRPERLSEYRRLWLEARLAGDWVAALQLQERRYRETGRASNSYAMALAYGVGRYEDALAIWEQVAEQSAYGPSAIVRWNLAGTLVALGRVVEAESVAVGLEGTPRELPMRTMIALRVRDWSTAERMALEVARDPAANVRWRSFALSALASARAARGRMHEAVAALQEMIWANQRLGRETGYREAHRASLLLTIAGGLSMEECELTTRQADTSQEARVVLGLWAVQLGDTALANSYLGALPVREPGEFGSPTLEDAHVALLHARVAGRRGDWEEAVRRLEPVTGDRAPRARGRDRILPWTLAEAYEELGQLDAAANLYGDIAVGRGIAFTNLGVWSLGLTYSFAHRKAALLYGQLGQNEAALEHWRAFLDAFTDPDPEYEWMVAEAREEVERLGRGR